MKKLAVGMAMLGAIVSVSALSQGLSGYNEEISPADAPGSTGKTQGQVLCVAAVNSTGTKAGPGLGVKSVTHVATGQYQVTFGGAGCGNNLTAKNGHARFVQVDTLTTGSIASGVRCTTADRSGVPAAVFVDCANAAGPLDTSFFLFIMR